MVNDTLGSSVDRLAGRTGLSGDAVAILMIVAGVLVIAFPALIGIVVGVTLIVLGCLWLVTRARERQAAGAVTTASTTTSTTTTSTGAPPAASSVHDQGVPPRGP